MTLSDTEPVFDIRELATSGGVSRRTVRYYIQRGLLSAPTGTGRGKHYTHAHLRELIGIRERQERGETLAEIAARAVAPAAPAAAVPAARQGDTWTRHLVAAGVELHVRSGSLDRVALARMLRAAAAAIGPEDTAG